MDLQILPFKSIFNAHIYTIAQTESTHTFVKNHLAQFSHGSILTTEHQSAGYGRHQRKWVSPPGTNLAYTLVLHPTTGIQLFSQYAQICAIVMARTLEQFTSHKFQVKWPNDVLYKKQKLCGILTEHVKFQGESRLLIGMGVNVNSQFCDFTEVERPITSLRIVTGDLVDKFSLLKQFLMNLGESLPLFEEEGLKPFLQEWMQFENFVGTRATICENNLQIQGIIEGITPNGALLFKVANEDAPRTIYAGDLVV
jgi:BirA family transcriptional regulator, biotin operon repressor / biotin---[acetyl-CoA-carboxylase] ligase